MHLKDLITEIEGQSDDELIERLRQIRHNRTVARPVARRKEAKAAKRESRAKTAKVEKLLTDLNVEEIQQLLSQLESGN